ncbi:MAG: hypothetical protein V4666_09730 [Bacteroidota bacterium]
MKKIFFCILILVFINANAQDKFEKGFFISNDGNKIECLIKNLDWMSNPKEFNYKLNEGEELLTGNINTVKEFQVYDKIYYKRVNVKIDRSSNRVEELSHQSNPEFKEEVLFLKVLINGKATLYSYEDGNIRRYFFEKDNNGKVEQFVYKQYIDIQNTVNSVSENKTYLNQLLVNFRIENLPNTYFDHVDYYKSDFVKYFIKYNESKNYEYKYFQVKRNKKLLSLSIRPGYTNSSVSFNRMLTQATTEFKQKSNFRLGIEAEIILPFNNDKWAIIIEPTYQKYNDVVVTNKGEYHEKSQIIDYKSIEIPIGIRYFFHLNKSSKIFINTAFITDLNFNSSIKTVNSYGNGINTVDEFPIKSSGNFTFGLGYKFLDKFSLEVRTGIKRELLSNNIAYTSSYKSFSVIFGYKIF